MRCLVCLFTVLLLSHSGLDRMDAREPSLPPAPSAAASITTAPAADAKTVSAPTAEPPAPAAGPAPGRHEQVVQGKTLAAIMAAVKALPPEGGTVFLPAGKYICNGPVVLDRDNITLRGAGPETILFTRDGCNCPVIIMGSTETPVVRKTRNLTVSDLTLDGNRHTQNMECWDGICDSGGRAYIRNNCLTVRGVEDSRIERIKATRGRSGGLVMEKVCRRVVVTDFEAWDNHFDGLACYETEESVFTGLHLHHNQYAGISLDIRFHRNAIVNSLLEHNGAQGIFMRDSSSNVFQNLTIQHNSAHGVFVAQVDKDASLTCRDNVFSGLRCQHMGGEAFRVNDASCTGNLLAHSVFAHNPHGDVSEAVAGQVTQLDVKTGLAAPPP
ncbi:MAG: Pectate lyase superfamily protein [Verrucomicrobiales bacterium]|nr:Pectate lyase superfamily protein [Verrucomicrobiales bacterium]